MFNSYAEMIDQIRGYGLEAVEDKLIRLARPAVVMSRTKVDEDTLPLGASKLGGNPDVPEGFEWLYVQEKPFTFIAQFRLSEVAKTYSDAFLSKLPQQMTLWDMDSIPAIRPTPSP